MANVKMMQGDCLELMKDIPDGSVDMILCDLPYGTTQNKWDKVIVLSLLFAEYKKLIKSGGVIALFSQQPFTTDLIQANRRQFRYEWIWEKSQGTGFLNANRMPLKAHENILIFYDKLPVYNPQFITGKKHSRGNPGGLTTNYGKFERIVGNKSNEYYPVDVIKFSKAADRLHPTQKPVDLLEYLIKTYTNEGETVLDNCMGSGSTGVACVNTNRNFIGIELDENYFHIAESRINQAIA
ncbi:MAG: site-specific DNA-methyltransferase, partial [Alphaproteobacteria bacterium]|nr:site-specific DNA-methyltransferase [Alphaproteobacteria bacterium]